MTLSRGMAIVPNLGELRTSKVRPPGFTYARSSTSFATKDIPLLESDKWANYPDDTIWVSALSFAFQNTSTTWKTASYKLKINGVSNSSGSYVASCNVQPQGYTVITAIQKAHAQIGDEYHLDVWSVQSNVSARWWGVSMWPKYTHRGAGFVGSVRTLPTSTGFIWPNFNQSSVRTHGMETGSELKARLFPMGELELQQYVSSNESSTYLYVIDAVDVPADKGLMISPYGAEYLSYPGTGNPMDIKSASSTTAYTPVQIRYIDLEYRKFS